MTTENLDLLVHKYMQAESTDIEEERLKELLYKDKNSTQYDDLRALIGYYELQRKNTAIPIFQNPSGLASSHRKRVISMPWIAAAASVVIIVLAYFFFKTTHGTSATDTFNDPVLAAQNASEALQILSGELNKGRAMALDQMKELDNINKYLNIF